MLPLWRQSLSVWPRLALNLRSCLSLSNAGATGASMMLSWMRFGIPGRGKWLRSYPVSSSSCRTLLITDNPVAYYNYSNAGTFTVKVRVVAEWEQTKPDATKGIVQKSGDFSASLRLRGRSPARLAGAEEPQTMILPDPCDSGLAWGCTMWIFSEPSSLFHVCSGESTQGRRQSHTVSP